MTLTMAIILYNKLKQGISVEPDVKPAAVMNHSTLDGIIHFYDTRWPQHEPFYKASSNEPFSDTIGFKASLVQKASLRHH